MTWAAINGSKTEHKYHLWVDRLEVGGTQDVVQPQRIAVLANPQEHARTIFKQVGADVTQPFVGGADGLGNARLVYEPEGDKTRIAANTKRTNMSSE